METRQSIRVRISPGAPPVLKSWELCWHVTQGALYLGIGDDGTGMATSVEQITGAGVVVAWADITGKPSTFPPSTHSHAWADITGKPSTFPPSTHSHAWADITGKPSTFPPSTHSHAWADITGKPSTFPPSTHSHAWNNITNPPATATRWPAWSEVTGKPDLLPTNNPTFTGTLAGPALVIGSGKKITAIRVQSTMPTSNSANDGTLYLIY